MKLINTKVLMSDATHFSTEQQINPYYNDLPMNLDAAVAEHTTILDYLKQAGIEVIQVPSPADSQDGVYTANWALVHGKTAILAHLPDARKAEEAHAEKVLTDLGFEVIHVPDNLKFSGQGDALACGNYLFCGNGYRSDLAAQVFAAEKLGYERIQLQTIPQLDESGKPVVNPASGWADSFFYDIDLALSIIKAPDGDQKGLIAYCPEAFVPESQKILADFDGVDKITISIEEAKNAFACNLVSTGETVINVLPRSAEGQSFSYKGQQKKMRTIVGEHLDARVLPIANLFVKGSESTAPITAGTHHTLRKPVQNDSERVAA